MENTALRVYDAPWHVCNPLDFPVYFVRKGIVIEKADGERGKSRIQP